VRRTVALGPAAALRRLGAKFLRAATHLPKRHADAEQVTYRLVLPFSGHAVDSFFARIPVDGLTPNAAQAAAISKQWLGHRFDLLGSGWVHVTYGMQ